LDLHRGLPFGDRCFDVTLCVRYLHHLQDAASRRLVIGEMLRVSHKFVLVSYYGRGNLHSLVRQWHTAIRGDRRPAPATMARSELELACATHGWEIAAVRHVLPWLHAHRLALLRRKARTQR